MTATGTPVPDDLEQRWSSLARPSGENLAAERVRDWAGGQVLVAVDASGRRYLLVRISDLTEVRLPRPLSGLDLEVRQLQPAGQADGSWLVLSPTQRSGERPFVGLASDVVAELPEGGAPDPAALFAVIDRWRRFFGRQNDGLSYEDQMGLIGELWFLLEWLPAFTVAAVEAWKGPLRGRHDWITPTISVEVKATGTSTGPVVHHIHRLDQLDEPGHGALYLFSVRAVRDPSGAESLDGLLEQARSAALAVGVTCANLLDDRLRAVGVTQSELGRYSDAIRIDQAELYEVHGEFPRLVPSYFPSGLPAGITDLNYLLDMGACRPWRIAQAPNEATVLSALLAGPSRNVSEMGDS